MGNNREISTRELVLEVLLEVTRDGAYSHIALNAVLEKYQYLEKQERSFITRVTEGTLERMIELDYIIDQFSTVKTKKMKPVIRNIIRSAVYQLKYMDSIPDSAVCNEAVKLAGRKGFSNLKGFVNGVLRNIARSLDKVEWPSPEQEPIEALSVRYSMPAWIVKQLMHTYDKEVTEQILAAFFDEDAVTVRCNQKKIKPQELKTRFEAAGVHTEVSPYLPYAFRVSGYNSIRELPGYQQGWFQVQDVSSMLVTEVAMPPADACCIDVCAAPGGKTIHLSEQLTSGQVEARDVSDHKVALIKENIARMGAENVTARVQDALSFDPDSVAKAGIVLVDAPCSGLGVLGKKTDIRYKMTREQQLELVRLQREILATVWPYVKPGGTLIYSTCTINTEENEGNVEWFCQHFPFETEDITGLLPEALRLTPGTAQGWIQLLPGVHDCDGFFVARLKRREEPEQGGNNGED